MFEEEECYSIDSYEDAVSYILSIPRFSGGNGLAGVKKLVKLGGFDALNARIFHIAGTNGKGSVCAFLTSVHMAMGKHVGTFTSPHLTDIRERIMIDGKMVSPDIFFEAFKKIRSLIRGNGNTDFNCFEVLFLIAMQIFKDAELDAIILETGLGGRLDATNAIDRKDVCIITEIGLDHMAVLGDTIELIAKEKAGIMRPGVTTVFADRKNGATDVIMHEAMAIKAVALPILSDNFESIASINKNIDFSYESRYYNNVTFKLQSRALYQVENALLAIAALEQVYGSDELTEDALVSGIYNMTWPGRMEEVLPGVFFDGAHNVDGIRSFLETVRHDDCGGRRLLLFSAVTDKQASQMVDMLVESSLFSVMATGHIDSDRGIGTDMLRTLFESRPDVIVEMSVTDAYERILQEKRQDDYLYACGSLYMIGELKGYLEQKNV